MVYHATCLSEQITGDVRLPLLVLLGAVGLLLLMAITNVANLTLGLVRRREHELVVRRAIGATSPRLLRQIVTQSAVVGLVGCAIGLVAAVAGVRTLLSLAEQARCLRHVGRVLAVRESGTPPGSR